MKKKRVTGIVQIYSKRARDQILLLGQRFFEGLGIADHLSDVFSCVDELIKNAVKANYKFVLIREKIIERITAENPGLDEKSLTREIEAVVRDKARYDQIAEEIARTENVSDIVRQVLNEENQQLKLKNKAYSENRSYTDDELAKLAGFSHLQRLRTELERQDVKVIVKIETDGEYLYIEVTNTAPILEKDLMRIYDKRDEYRSYCERGEEYMFFMNNLDTSESGFGLGYATIDSFLINMGLDPARAVQIIAASDTTVILSLPFPHCAILPADQAGVLRKGEPAR